MIVVDTKGVKLEEAKNDPMVGVGPVFRKLLVDGKISKGYSMAIVKYDKGSKLKWHTHDSEQIIIGTDGKGILATKEQEHIVTPGVVVVVPAGEVHYHGAAPGKSFTHIAFYSGSSQVLDK